MLILFTTATYPVIIHNDCSTLFLLSILFIEFKTISSAASVISNAHSPQWENKVLHTPPTLVSLGHQQYSSDNNTTPLSITESFIFTVENQLLLSTFPHSQRLTTHTIVHNNLTNKFDSATTFSISYMSKLHLVVGNTSRFHSAEAPPRWKYFAISFVSLFVLDNSSETHNNIIHYLPTQRKN